MKLRILYFSLIPLGVLLISLFLLRLSDYRSDRNEWNRLLSIQPSTPALFDLTMIAGLPEPAQRFFKCVIKEGTPLLTVAEIDMGGEFSLGSREKPDYQKMEAYQILAAPAGFVWRLKLPGPMFISGSDSGKWTRFRILGIIPVARMGGDPDHTRAAYGRYAAESVFWTPAAVLPGRNVRWDSVDENTARATISSGSLAQEVDVRLGKDGCPTQVTFQRWSDANKDKKYRLQPFGGKLSDFREVRGFKIPFRVEAANLFGTPDEFYFFKAEIKDVRFRSP